MEKPTLVLLLLFLAALHSLPGIPLALGLESEVPLPAGEAENTSKVGEIAEGDSRKAVPLTKLVPSLQQRKQDMEEAEQADAAEEPLYESTIVTTIVEEHAEASVSGTPGSASEPPEKTQNLPVEPAATVLTPDCEPSEDHPAEPAAKDHPAEPAATDLPAEPGAAVLTPDSEPSEDHPAEPAAKDHPAEPAATVLTPDNPTPPQEALSPNQDQAVTNPSSREGPDPEGELTRSSEEEDEEEGCEQEASPEGMRRIAEAMMEFSKDIFKEVDLESKQPNIVLSPLSIALGLSQLALGAGAQTEKKILQALHVESARCLHNTLRTVRKEMTQRVLRLAARMYIRKGFQVKGSFRKRSETFYGAKPVMLGPRSEDNLNAINAWVKEVTEGRIPTFLSKIPDDLVLLLLNAMHFKGIWMNKFDASQTSEDKFHLNDQSIVSVQMMKASKYPLSYFSLDHLEAQVARLPFKGNMSFIVILPHNFELDASKVLDQFNLTEVYSLFRRETPTLLKVPKLLLDFRQELSQVLTKLGLGELFSSPDLRRISEEALSVSSVQHQSTLELNEEGVEASAATSLQISRSFASFSINRPFMFLLLDDITGMPLFLGHVRNPNPSAPVKNTAQSDSPDPKYFMNGYDPK